MKPEFLELDINSIDELEDNPRIIHDAEFKSLCRDIKSDPNFLIQRPPLVNHDTKSGRKIIYAGNQRYKATKHLGYKTIWVWVEKDVPKKVQDDRMLKDNLHRGVWDFDKLQLLDVSTLGGAGFGDDFLSSLFKETVEVIDDSFDVEKAKEEIRKPKTKLGDRYQLGQNRLVCGDCTDLGVIEFLFGEEKASMVYCDPPYNIGLSYDKGIKGNSTKKTYTDKVFSDNKSPDDYKAFLVKTIANAKQVIDDRGAHIFYWCDPKFIGWIQEVYKTSGVSNKNVCFWLKNQFNPVQQIAFNRIMEPCVYGVIGKPYLFDEVKNLSEVLNKEVTGKNVKECWESMLDVWFSQRVRTNNYEHPTQKPCTLHEKPIRRCTAPGDLILDFFGGSGSTLIAAEQMKRRAYLTELDPVFCDVIIKRWETLTGEKAIKLDNYGKGKTK